MNVLEIQNSLIQDSRVWHEIKNNDILLFQAANVVRGKFFVCFTAPVIVGYIINNREDVSPDVFNYLKDSIFFDVNIARSEVYNNITYLNQLFSVPNLMLKEREKCFAVNEAMNAYKIVSDRMSRTIHGIEPYDLKFQILMNPSWSEEEKKELIYKFYLSDPVYNAALSSFCNYYDSNDSYKVRLFEFLFQNSPGIYKYHLENNEKKLVK